VARGSDDRTADAEPKLSGKTLRHNPGSTGLSLSCCVPTGGLQAQRAELRDTKRSSSAPQRSSCSASPS